MNEIDIVKINNLIDLAATEGVDAAILVHGDVINAREAAALKALSQEELVSLSAINRKITDTSRFNDVADWTCGAIC